ncbi:MAG: thioredoxin family protein [Deltaproteobacteria bacterium]|nr:thioredoxin family protein [Deltaproteobacteria bacterium]
MVGGQRVGIIGLKETLQEVAARLKEEEIKEVLLSSLSAKNYIPEKVKEDYRTAFFREYKKFIGEPVEEDAGGGLQIKILGPGCPNCDALEQTVMGILAETGISADVEHVRDPIAIAEFGVMGTPALVLNGRVKAVGKIPPKAALRNMIKGAGANGMVS